MAKLFKVDVCANLAASSVRVHLCPSIATVAHGPVSLILDDGGDGDDDVAAARPPL